MLATKLKAHKEYISYFFRHKYWVYIEGKKLGLPRWRLLVHDLSKLKPSEWFGYVNWKYSQIINEGGGTNKNNRGYGRSWHLHYLRNPHHYQHWLYIDDQTGECYPVEMPDIYRREMLADWSSAGIVRFGKPGLWEYYQANEEILRKLIHPQTLGWLEKEIKHGG